MFYQIGGLEIPQSLLNLAVLLIGFFNKLFEPQTTLI